MNKKVFDVPYIDEVLSIHEGEKPLSLGERRKRQILEAAFEVLLHKGYDGTSMQDIAQAAKVKRTLVHHYFKTKDEIIDLLVIYVRTHYQNFVVTKMKEQNGAPDTLKTYIEAALMWPIEFPKHIRLWLLFFYWCTFKEKYRIKNSEFVRIGFLRIEALLEEGISAKLFSFSEPAKLVAKQIQIAITGGVISLATEQLSKKEQTQIINKIVLDCLKLVRRKA